MRLRKNVVLVLSTLSLIACSVADTDTDVTTTDAPTPSTTNISDAVEITLIDMLDGVTSSYCIDIAGGNKDIDITKGLQAHTCYSYRGEIGTDQTFSTRYFAENALYMPDFDVCATVDALQAGAAIGLASCEGSDLQNIVFSDTGTISMMAAPDLCFTAAKDSRFGRSEVHQIKALSLEACSEDLAPYQKWRGRSSAD